MDEADHKLDMYNYFVRKNYFPITSITIEKNNKYYIKSKQKQKKSTANG